MVSLFALWLPILVSSVFVFVVSALIHMVLGYHASDFTKLPDETGFLDLLRKLNPPDGTYMYPYAGSRAEMKAPEFRDKLKKGPGVIMSLWSGNLTSSMGRNLFQWFVYVVVIGIISGYVASRAVGSDVRFLAIFRFAGVTAFACYAAAGWPESIWYRRPWSVTLKSTFDGLVFAVITGATFGWLWPQ